MSLPTNSRIIEQDVYFLTLFSFPQAILMIDDKSRIVFVNEKFLTDAQLQENIMMDRYLWEYMTGDNQTYLDYLLKSMEMDTAAERELKNIHLLLPNHKSVSFHLQSAQLIKDKEQRKYLVLFMALSHVTKVPNEKAYWLDSILQSIGDPLLVFNDKGETEYVNHAFQALSIKEDISLNSFEDLHQIYDFYNFKGKELSNEQLPMTEALRGGIVEILN